MSFFLLPFYLTLNFYEIRLAYIFNFGAFVISSCSLALMMTSFFKDHKIAAELIGICFSLGSFLPLMYKGPTALNS
jgi:nitrate/nitrite transporter NarK